MIPAFWALAAGVVQVLSLLPLRTTTHSSLTRTVGGMDIYYVKTAFHYSLGLAAMLGIFAILYGVLALMTARYRSWLGYAHLVLSAGGSVLILTPSLALVTMRAIPADPIAAFNFWNGISSVGYTMTLAGVAVFVVVLIDAWRHRASSVSRPAR
jgi:cytochrome c oxidase subunit 1